MREWIRCRPLVTFSSFLSSSRCSSRRPASWSCSSWIRTSSSSSLEFLFRPSLSSPLAILPPRFSSSSSGSCPESCWGLSFVAASAPCVARSSSPLSSCFTSASSCLTSTSAAFHRSHWSSSPSSSLSILLTLILRLSFSMTALFLSFVGHYTVSHTSRGGKSLLASQICLVD